MGRELSNASDRRREQQESNSRNCVVFFCLAGTEAPRLQGPYFDHTVTSAGDEVLVHVSKPLRGLRVSVSEEA